MMSEQPRQDLGSEREIGPTEVEPAARRLLVLGFLATLLAPTAWQGVVADLRPPPAADADAELGGPLAANRRLLATIERIEDHLETTSPLRAAALSRIQGLLTRFGGAGNRQVYVGRAGWLFLRPAVDHLTGPGFLDPLPVRGAIRQEDPMPALRDLHRLLSAHGVELLVVPVPGKAAIHPQALSRHASGPVRNPDELPFLERVQAAGLRAFDPTPTLVEAATRDEAQFLRTDSHWTPQGMERVAAALAEQIGALLDRPLPEPPVLDRVVITQSGDLARMLALPPASRLYPPETAAVVAATAPGPADDRTAPVLLLGDSFTNVYSQAALGWGAGAGLAERLSHHLGLPVERLAINAGGAYASRERLRQELRDDPARLEGKRLVVYQFASRELSFGDWRRFAP